MEMMAQAVPQNNESSTKFKMVTIPLTRYCEVESEVFLSCQDIQKIEETGDVSLIYDQPLTPFEKQAIRELHQEGDLPLDIFGYLKAFLRSSPEEVYPRKLMMGDMKFFEGFTDNGDGSLTLNLGS